MVDGIKAKVIGGDRLRRRLAALPGAVAKPVREAIATSAKQIESEMQRSMRGPKTGRIYKRKSVTHRASAPDEAPAVDTGILRSSLAVKVDADGLGASIGVHDVTRVKYARHLEYGTQKMAARPFIFPAFEKHKSKSRARIAEAVNAALRTAQVAE